MDVEAEWMNQTENMKSSAQNIAKYCTGQAFNQQNLEVCGTAAVVQGGKHQDFFSPRF